MIKIPTSLDFRVLGMKFIYRLWVLVTFFSMNYVYAVVPTFDMYQSVQDSITTGANYAVTISAYLDKIGQAITVANQIQNLKGLNDLTNLSNSICDLCSPIQHQQLNTYINNVNMDLCSQFKYALDNITGMTHIVRDLNDIIGNFHSNPQQAGLALQRAAIATQQISQNTLAQIQLLMAQQAQKQLAEQKLEKEDTNEVYVGFDNAGL